MTWGLLALLLTVSPDGGTAWCVSCHAREGDRYAQSRHTTARVGPLYVANHAEEPMHWCDGCHAPQGQGEDGIGCAACHVRGGVVLSSREPTAKAQQAHRTVRDAKLGAEGACEGCHQVNFPVGKAEPVTLSGFRMQATIDEWRAAGSSRTCVGCHMPQQDHRITGGHDVGRVLRALEVEVGPGLPGEVKLTLRNVGTPHALPTGDPFRAFEWQLCADEACEHVVATHRFGRTIARVEQTWHIVADVTVPGRTDAGPGVRTFEVTRPASANHWRLSLRYVGDATAAHLPPELVASELARGALP